MNVGANKFRTAATASHQGFQHNTTINQMVAPAKFKVNFVITPKVPSEPIIKCFMLYPVEVFLCVLQTP